MPKGRDWKEERETLVATARLRNDRVARRMER
jgi:hypothetical protein